MILEPPPPMPLDEALRLAKLRIRNGDRVDRALLAYIEVLELGASHPLPAVDEVRAAR